jgi:TPR repeat protein
MTMARNRSFIPYGEPDEPYDQGFVGAYDEESGDPEFMAYGSAPAMAAEEYPLPEDPRHPEDALLPMPLFLAENGQELRRRGFGSGGRQNLNLARGSVWPRIFKAGMVAASAAAIAFGILSVGNPLALFEDAKALLAGATADQSGAAQNVNPQPSAVAPFTAAELASAGPPTAVLPSAAAVTVSTPTAGATPTRDDMALALKAAQQSPVLAPQSQVQAVQPPAAPAPLPVPVRRLAADELATLLKRAKGLIAIGDITPARLLLERAAEAQEPSAALLLAQTYDPAVLGTQDMRSVTPDPAKARDWYAEAARLGSMDARQRLAEMRN